MSEYPAWWDATITVYNKYTNPLTKAVTWFRHVLSGCFWDNTGNRLIAENAQIQSNDVVCRIPQSDIYKPRGEWESLPNDIMSNYFTLGKADILIRGEIDDVIDETVKGHRATDLIAKYKDKQDCIVLKRFSDNTGTSRVMPHYYVTGE